MIGTRELCGMEMVSASIKLSDECNCEERGRYEGGRLRGSACKYDPSQMTVLLAEI